jgi:hypothetical protein
MLNDFYDELNVVWDALHGYRENCIPEGQKQYDHEWNAICTAMALITEELKTIPQR